MAFTLTDDEVRALRRAIDNYLPELRRVAAHFERGSEARELVELEHTLIDLRKRM